MKKEFADFLHALLGVKETKIGDVPKEILDKLKDTKERRVNLEKELKTKIEELEKQYEPGFEDLANEKESVWDEMYEFFGLYKEDRERPYAVNDDGEFLVMESLKK